MPLQWKLFRILCALQVVGALVMAMAALVDMLKTFSFLSILSLTHWLLVIGLAGLAISILQRNYPHTPVSGAQKSNFNRLYLLNFLFLAVFFSIIVSEYKTLSTLASYAGTEAWKLDIKFIWPLLVTTLLLIGQFTVLYGLFVLRRELYVQGSRKQFEFEEAK